MISSRSVRLKTVSKFRKRKRKSLYRVFALHNRALSCRSRAVTAKKCTKKRDARAKLLLNLLLFLRPQRGFPNVVLKKKTNIYEH